MLSDELVLSVTVFQRDDCVYAVSSFCIAHYSLWILIAVLTVYINVGELHLTQLIGFILTVYTLYHIGWKALMHRFHLNRKANRDVERNLSKNPVHVCRYSLHLYREDMV